jgi:hypothetical protein
MGVTLGKQKLMSSLRDFLRRHLAIGIVIALVTIAVLIATLYPGINVYIRVGLLIAVAVLLLGYTVGSVVLGFGPHVVKKTETYEYKEDKDEQVKKSETYETQYYRTVWDWLTVLTISAVIAAVALFFTWSQGKQQRYVQDQQARDDALLAYFDTMSGLIFDRHLLVLQRHFY